MTTSKTLLVGVFCITLMQPITVWCGVETSSSNEGIKGTYCPGDEFKNARCQSEVEVPVITKAIYGSDNSRTCTSETSFDWAQSNCSKSVIEVLNGHCSGRLCSVAIPDETLVELTGCPNSTGTFLYVEYSCVKVLGKGCQAQCASQGHVLIKEGRGNLSSFSASQNPPHCGGAKCPWYFRVQPGQRINLTLQDYSPWSKEQLKQQLSPTTPSSLATTTPRPWGQEYCRTLAVIKEKANPKEIPLCAQRMPRVRHVYTSISNSLQVEIAETGSTASFMLQYEVIGCKDIEPPLYSRMMRREHTIDIDCPADGKKWTLTCVGGEWEGLDELGECTPEARAFAPLNPFPRTTEASLAAVDGSGNDPNAGGILNTLSNLPFGVVITLVVAVAIIIIVLIITSGSFYIKKRTFDKKYNIKGAGPIYGGQACSEFEFRQDMDHAGAYLVPKGIAQTLPSKSRRSSDDLLGRGDTYGGDKKWETRPLPSIPRNGTDRSRMSGDFPPNPTHPQFHNFTGAPPGYHSVCSCPPHNHLGYPTRFAHPNGMPAGNFTGNGQFPNYPPPSTGGSRVTVQMHRPDPNQIDMHNRRPAPQGTAAVVYRGGGGPLPPRGPPSRASIQSNGGDHTYFILDQDAVADDPAAEVIDPMSLPRTNTRNTGRRFDEGKPTGIAEPLVTSDGRLVEDVVLNPVECPGTNGQLFTAPGTGEPPYQTTVPDYYDQFDPSAVKQGNGSCRGSTAEDHWPPPPDDLLLNNKDTSSLEKRMLDDDAGMKQMGDNMTKSYHEPITSLKGSPGFRGYENGSLETVPLRPQRD